MLCAVPFFGGHYLVDMVAGAAAMLLALALRPCAAEAYAASASQIRAESQRSPPARDQS